MEVSDEIADLLKELDRAEDAYRIRTYRHKAVYSLELMNELKAVPADEPSPEELLEQDNMKELLYEGLRSLPEKQRSRLIAYYFLGMSKVEIARSEECDPAAILRSIEHGEFLPQKCTEHMEGLFPGLMSDQTLTRYPSVALAGP